MAKGADSPSCHDGKRASSVVNKTMIFAHGNTRHGEDIYPSDTGMRPSKPTGDVQSPDDSALECPVIPVTKRAAGSPFLTKKAPAPHLQNNRDTQRLPGKDVNALLTRADKEKARLFMSQHSALPVRQLARQRAMTSMPLRGSLAAPQALPLACHCRLPADGAPPATAAQIKM